MEKSPNLKELNTVPRQKNRDGSSRSLSASASTSSKRKVRSSNKKIPYKVYYRKQEKAKFSALQEGVLYLTNEKIVVQNSQGEEILEKQNTEKIRSFASEHEFKIGMYEIEIIKQLAKSEANLLVSSSLKRKSSGVLSEQDFDFQIPEGSLILDSDLKVFVEPFITAKLRPHQVEGVKFMYDCISGKQIPGHNGCILADCMGLGKTLTTLALIYTFTKKFASYQSQIKKCVVICPATLILNWKAEISKWLGNRLTPVTCIGSKKEKIKQIHIFEKGQSPLLIISYDSIMKFTSILNNSCDLIVCDEGHKIKNHNTKKYQAIDNLKCMNRVLLTGTPLQNFIKEFYTCVNLVNRDVLGIWPVFRAIYCNPIMRAQEPDAADHEKELAAMRSEELWQNTKKFILRRTGKIIEGHLPPKNEYMLFMPIQPLQEKIYLSFLHSKIAAEARELGYNENVLALITMLRKITNHPDLIFYKEPHCRALHQDWVLAMNLFPEGYKKLIDKTEFSAKLKFVISLTEICTKKKEKLIVVSNFTKTLDIVQEHFELSGFRYMRLDGNTPTQSRMKIVDEFNSASAPLILLLSSKAGGCGLNLIGANRLVMFDNDWNPSNDKQAMARIWRDGQKKEVHIYRLIVYGTIEEKIYQRQTTKEKLSLHVVDAKKVAPKFSSDFLRIIFTLGENIESFTKGDDVNTLQGSWLDQVDIDIPMVKRIRSDWDEEIHEEECKVINPKNQIAESRASESTDFSTMTKHKKTK